MPKVKLNTKMKTKQLLGYSYRDLFNVFDDDVDEDADEDPLDEFLV